jgi:uncharacterized protein (DUF3084 family)
VSIALETYDYIKQVAADKDQRSAPFYDTLQSIIREFEQLKEIKEDLEIVRELLAVAMEDKRLLKEEKERIKKELEYNQFN